MVPSMKKAKIDDGEVKNKRGQPRKSWDQKGVVAKKKEVKEFSETLIDVPREKLLLAVARVMKKSGDKDLADLLEFASFEKSRSKELMDKIKMKIENVRQISPQDALAMLYDANLGKTSYIAVQRAAQACGKSIFPCYDRVRMAKSECSPAPETITVGDTYASVNLNALLQHTAERIVTYQTKVLMQEKENIADKTLTFVVSWGMDGSSGYSNYKQGYTCDAARPNEDSSLFAVTINPLRIHDGDKIYWNNMTPQSYRFCRPLKLMFAKESKALVTDEYRAIQDQISNLQICEITVKGSFKIKIRFSLHFTIIDGKVLAIIQGTSSQACPVCWCSPKEFNVPDNFKNGVFNPKPETLVHGLSCLHAYIRGLEYFLKIAYRLSFKQWQARGADLQAKVKVEKERIQKQLWDALKLRVDYPNPTGGTSNDGNTARRAFQNYKEFARVLCIEEDIIMDFRTILIALSCQFPIHAERFKNHCDNLYTKLMKNYGWYLLPSSIHKLLVHGAEIISASPLPVGMLAEDCAESRNKCYKFDRTHRAPKTSRRDTLTDMFQRSLGTSDPLISSISIKCRANIRSRKPLPPEVIALLHAPNENFKSVPHSSFDLTELDNGLTDEEILEIEVDD